MIISRTPFRISLAGGGTDLPDYYRRNGGCVTSFAVSKYMYITVHEPFDKKIRLQYAQSEVKNDVDDIEHPLIRECLKLLGIGNSIQIVSVADIPARAGLGSSSSFAVGLLHALHAFRGEHVSADRLAEEACEVEIERMGDPIGKQDQYIAAHGGFKHIAFNPDDSVFVDPVIWPRERRDDLHRHLMLFHCGMPRSAREILRVQKSNIPQRLKDLARLAEMAVEVRDVLTGNDNLGRVGDILHEAWMIKRTLTETISNTSIDDWYEKARAAGATGGKLLGAGGGGFLLFFVEPERQDAVRKALDDLRRIPFEFEPEGSKIVHVA